MHAPINTPGNDQVGTGSSVNVLDGSIVRGWLFIQNTDTVDVLYVNFGSAAASGRGIKIGPGGAIEFFSRLFMPSGDLHVLGAAGKPFTVLFA